MRLTLVSKIKPIVISLLLLTAKESWSATVKAVKPAKGLVEITPNDGESLEKNLKVCFFNSSKKKVACGNVVGKKGENRVFVRVKNKKRIKKIQPGMSTTLPEGETTAGSDSSKQSPFRIWVDFGMALATPYIFNKVGYSPQPSDAPPTTLWNKEGVESKGQAFNLQVGIPIGKFSINPGFRFRPSTVNVVETDYEQQVENPYASTSHTVSGLGLYTDFGFLYIRSSTFMTFNATAGLDIDKSSVEVVSKKKTDKPEEAPITGSETIASYKSSLNVISLRVGGSVEFVKMFGGRLGLNILLPLAGSGSASAEISEGEDKGLADAVGDFKSAVDHKKNSIAYEIGLGLMLEF